ncbi:MAG: hypothetical protein ACOX5Z_11910 [Desulfobulbus sp.]
MQPCSFRFHNLPTETLDLPDELTRALYAGTPDPKMVEQVRRFGLQQPLPVVCREDGCFHLLAGFALLGALRTLAIPEVCCQVLEHGASPQKYFALQLFHGLSTVRSSLVLQANLLRQAVQTLPEKEVLPLLPLMGQKPHRHTLKKLLAVLNLDPTVLHALHSGVLAARTIQYLNRLAPADQQALVACITTYRAGGSKQQKLAETVTELALLTNTPVADLLHACQSRVSGADPHNLPQQLQQLLANLQEQHAPAQTAAEQQFQQTIQSLQPPPGITIQHCPSFEDDSLTVHLHFPSLESLRQCWPAITALPLGKQPPDP